MVPDDFLVYCSQAFQQLSEVQRSNVLYSLAKGIGTMRTGRSESLFPVTRMPMGLLEFMVNFFVANDSRSVSLFHLCIKVSWYIDSPGTTMYVCFGQKWMKLHHGPLWSVAGSMQSEIANAANTTQPRSTSHPISEVRIMSNDFVIPIYLFTVQARVNIPSLSESTIRRDIAASSITLTSELQVGVNCTMYYDDYNTL